MENRRKTFGLLQLGIIVSALATAGIHAYLASTSSMVLVMFTLNALGYVGLLAALYLPLPWFRDHRKLVRYALLAFTLVTILGWVAIGERSTIAYVDKAFEGLLVVLLLFERP